MMRTSFIDKSSAPTQQSMGAENNNQIANHNVPSAPPAYEIAVEEEGKVVHNDPKLSFLALVAIPPDSSYCNILLHKAYDARLNSENHLITRVIPFLPKTNFQTRQKEMMIYPLKSNPSNNNNLNDSNQKSYISLWSFFSKTTQFHYIQIAQFNNGPVTESTAKEVFSCLTQLINVNYNLQDLAKIPTSYTINDINQLNLEKILTAYNSNNLSSITEESLKLNPEDKYDRPDGYRTLTRRSTIRNNVNGPSYVYYRREEYHGFCCYYSSPNIDLNISYGGGYGDYNHNYSCCDHCFDPCIKWGECCCGNNHHPTSGDCNGCDCQGCDCQGCDCSGCSGVDCGNCN